MSPVRWNSQMDATTSYQIYIFIWYMCVATIYNGWKGRKLVAGPLDI